MTVYRNTSTTVSRAFCQVSSCNISVNAKAVCTCGHGEACFKDATIVSRFENCPKKTREKFANDHFRWKFLMPQSFSQQGWPISCRGIELSSVRQVLLELTGFCVRVTRCRFTEPDGRAKLPEFVN